MSPIEQMALYTQLSSRMLADFQRQVGGEITTGLVPELTRALESTVRVASQTAKLAHGDVGGGAANHAAAGIKLLTGEWSALGKSGKVNPDQADDAAALFGQVRLQATERAR